MAILLLSRIDPPDPEKEACIRQCRTQFLENLVVCETVYGSQTSIAGSTLHNDCATASQRRYTDCVGITDLGRCF
ncbi:MAG: hypothetical protein AAGH87_04710 [Pseudomonadota bacterium]